MSADLLRRAAERLRDPYRCNTDWITDQALATLLEAHARLWEASGPEPFPVFAATELLDVARAVLRDRADDDAHPATAAARAVLRGDGESR